jgi:hypothetical protein
MDPFSTQRNDSNTMKQIHLLKLSLWAASAALVAGTGSLARANDVADGTYTFEATDGNTALDGSTVTWSGDLIDGWNLVDSAQGGQGEGLPLTVANSSIIEQGTFGTNDWYFEIGSPSGVDSTSDADFFFEGENIGTIGFLYDKAGDPTGTWTQGSVPDSSGTLELIAGALVALAVCRSLVRGKTAAWA